MSANAYEAWISIYNNDIKATWESERTELRKVCMIYCAFEKELKNLKNTLDQELSEIRLEFKKKDQLQKCKNFKGLAQTENFDDDIIEDKENEIPNVAPMQDEIIRIESLSSPESFEYILSSPKQDKNLDENKTKSPILKQRSFSRPKRKKSPQCLFPLIQEKIVETPKFNDDSNIMESSIVEETPKAIPTKKSKILHVKSKKRDQCVASKKKKTTVTQMFYELEKPEKEINSNLSSMSVSDIIKVVNDSSDSDTASELDQSEETTDDIKQTQSSENKSEEKDKQEDQFVYHEVVRGNARKKLRGWSCRECEEYYSALNLSPEELTKKMDECSRHRSKFEPRNETFKGFWDLTLGPTPPTQNTEQSIVFNYNTKFKQ